MSRHGRLHNRAGSGCRRPAARTARSRCRHRDGGMVTAETAILLPALALVLAGLLWLITGVMGQIRCIDAAREAARLGARGDGSGRAIAAARRLAPSSAYIAISRQDGDVVATVSSRWVPFGGWAGRLVALPLSATARATDEDVLPGSTAAGFR